MSRRQVIHRALGNGCLCTPRELLNATTDIERVTCRSCLRLTHRTSVRSANYLANALSQWGKFPLVVRRYETPTRARGRLMWHLLRARFTWRRLYLDGAP